MTPAESATMSMGALGRVVRSSFFAQLMTLITISVACKAWLGTQEHPGDTIHNIGFFGPLLVIALQGSTVATPMGTSMIPVVNGMLFPLLFAVILNLAGGLTGGVVMYYIWRRGDRDLNLRDRIGALPPWVRRFARTDLLSLIAMRMLPWAGGNLATFMAGAHRIPLRVHVLAVIVGSLPGSIIYALVGAGIISL